MPRTTYSSSTLLTEIMQRPLDPGYAVAHRRRAEREHERAAAGQDGPSGPDGPGGDGDPAGDAEAVAGGSGPGGSAAGPARHRLRRLLRRHAVAVTVLGLGLGVPLGVAVGAGVAELRAAPLETRDRAVLEAEIDRRTSVADSLAASNEALREEIEQQQAAVLAEGSQSVLEAADRLAVPVGAVAVEGDGVVVTMDDAADVAVDASGEGGFGDDGRVRDGDVQTVVNALWSAGAEAVAVNGQRLTALSTIRHAGDAIVVDLRQLARPYVIEAVGDQDALLDELTGGRVADYTRFLGTNYGIGVSHEARDDLRLPPASRLTLRHAGAVAAERPEASVQEDGQS
ncbi:DUF881 domain-containing protein [Aquipuribacter sp. SD81]|uniref:DUF881 domain-containing protein n=1 Tax=Aquipuribacter sp. SD81 TaxID=3127703 RepID=UPI00301A74DD